MNSNCYTGLIFGTLILVTLCHFIKMADIEDGFSFVWKIDKFSMLPHQLGDYLESQTFVIDANRKADLFLSLYPRGSENKDYIAIYLCKRQKEEQLKLNFSFTIESTGPSKEITQTVTNHGLETSWGYKKFMNLSELFSKKQLYLPQDTLTLRCDISQIAETPVETTVYEESNSISTFLKKRCVSRTFIEIHKRSIPWYIRNIVERIDEELAVTSLTLASALKNTPRLKLTLIFNKRGMTEEDFVQILIGQTSQSSKKDRLFVKCKVTLISAYADKQVFEESTHLFELYSSDVWTFPPFITRSMLMDKNNHFEDDTVTLLCEFAFSYKNKIHHLENNYMPLTFKTGKQNSQLSTCFENIYADKKLCDIELKVGNKTFHYYKLLLCARSPVFGAMLEIYNKENNSNVVEIDDVDADTVQRMLKYMYSDVLEENLTPEETCKLYAVADKYQIGSLKRRCIALLMSALSVESVCDILALADDYQDKLLMTAAFEFISRHANEVFYSKQWESLMDDHPKLTSSFMHQMLKGKYQA